MAESSQEDEYWQEYWHASETKAFNFEDDQFGSELYGVPKSGTARLSQRVREGMGGDSTCFSADSLSGFLSRTTISDSSQTTTRPLHTLISEKSLLCILNAGNFHEKEPKGNLCPEEEVTILRRQVEDRWVPPPAKDTITKILLGHPYSLELYRSLKSKAELLDAAVAVGDGNAMLAVVLFLVRTLKKSYVHQLLRTRPDAVAQYCQYLSTRLQVHELTDLLEMLGESREASMKQFQLAVCGTMNPLRRLQNLKSCLRNHFSLPDNKDRPLVDNYIKLLEWQLAMAGTDAEVAKVLLGQPVLSSLAYTCQHHWGEPRGRLSSPQTLSEQQGVSDRQFQWTVLTVQASKQSWDDIEKLFITKSWMGGKKLKAALPMEQVVMQLHAHGAPRDILNKYLDLIDNVDKRVKLEQKLQSNKVFVDVNNKVEELENLLPLKYSIREGI
ncbi:hypothetical protein Cfor_09872 [Coptotermes formosanus]|uniref:Vps16 C-terminal domain-containing protein n=1 Tax=Coptotermes formosanus TaxID=36987 RepID=A0A6L2PN96_COPFO|nr:hypothetical protein Cfor_09872 [Coptotermes formosanus]